MTVPELSPQRGSLRALLARPGLVPLPAPTPRRRLRRWIRRRAEVVLAHPAFPRVLVLVLILQALWVIVGSAVSRRILIAFNTIEGPRVATSPAV